MDDDASLDDFDVLSLGTFVTFDDFKLYSLTFAQGSETLSIDRREVYENIFFAVISGDKAIAFFAVEPLD